MENIAMRYGDGTVSFAIGGMRSVRTLAAPGLPPLDDLPAALLRALEHDAIGSPPLSALLSPEDHITLVVSDITRFWMRQDLIIPLLIDFLTGALRIPHENIAILIALGTHRPQTEAEMQRLVTPEVYARVRVVNHDCDERNLLYAGTTSRGTRVCVNPLVIGRKVILLGATVHHLMSGFGGGRKSILPGVSARQTIYANHLHALSPTEARSNPLIGMGKLTGNPLHEDMTEAAAFIAPTFGVNLVACEGRHVALCCGHWQKAWEQSCSLVHGAFGLPISEQADVVIASCGGYPRDIDLYQGTKSLLNAAQAVKPGGTILFLAECREGGGSPEFFSWLQPLRRGTLDPDLREGFNIPGYIFYAACEAISRAKTYMLSNIPAETVADMGILAGASLAELLFKIPLEGRSVYLMPSAGSTVPYLP